jgi:hypothetical protein
MAGSERGVRKAAFEAKSDGSCPVAIRHALVISPAFRFKTIRLKNLKNILILK